MWLIDFAKTVHLPENHFIDHSSTWKVGNHEDGYLIGINNLIELFTELDMEINTTSSETPPSNSLSPSSGSSPTSLSPKRSVSETNVEDISAVTNIEKQVSKDLNTSDAEFSETPEYQEHINVCPTSESSEQTMQQPQPLKGPFKQIPDEEQN